MSNGDADALYGLPLDEFTAARDELATRLRKSGDKDEAARIKKLRKPSLAAWAVNQVARRKPEKVQRLFDLRKAIESATDARVMRSLSEERTASIAELVAEAGAILQGAGHATGAGTMQAITQTFHAGDDETGRADLLAGRLARELQPTWFGALGSALEAGTVEAEPSDPKLEELRRRAEELGSEAEGAEEEADRLEREAAAAERGWKSARAKAATARRSAEESRRRAERARAESDSQRG